VLLSRNPPVSSPAGTPLHPPLAPLNPPTALRSYSDEWESVVTVLMFFMIFVFVFAFLCVSFSVPNHSDSRNQNLEGFRPSKYSSAFGCCDVVYVFLSKNVLSIFFLTVEV
jgi:hypothetical protein